MCDTALSRAALELTQKIQLHFPSDIDPNVVQAWNGCPARIITEQLKAAFGHNPNSDKPVDEMKVLAKAKPSLLEHVGSKAIAAATEKFVAKTKFVVNTADNAPVKISYIWDDFQDWFLSGDGKVEEPITEQTLRFHKLRRQTKDSDIIAELGGEEKVETTLTEAYSLMEKQKNGGYGVLLHTGYTNIFFVKDQNGVLRTVGVSWDCHGWRVYADKVEHPSRWGDNRLVFSRSPKSAISDPSF